MSDSSEASLHGSAPDNSPLALLLIDVINDLEFDHGPQLLEAALPVAHALRELKRRAKAAGVPVIYVNDNYGRWQSSFERTVEHVLEDGVRGEPLARLLAPEDDDYFVLKPKHSGFFATTLDTLLEHLGARTLVLTGIATDSCVLFTAGDAHMRGYHVIVPCDGVAAANPESGERALALMRAALGAETAPTTAIDFDELRDRARR